MFGKLIRIGRFVLILILSLLIVTVLKVSRFVYWVSNTLFYLGKVLESYVVRRLEMSTRIGAGVCFVFWSLFVCIISAIGLVILLFFWINEMLFGIPDENVEEGILNILQQESMTVTALHKRIQEQYCFSKLTVKLYESVLYDLMSRGLVERDYSKTEICYHLSEKGKQAKQVV